MVNYTSVFVTVNNLITAIILITLPFAISMFCNDYLQKIPNKPENQCDELYQRDNKYNAFFFFCSCVDMRVKTYDLKFFFY